MESRITGRRPKRSESAPRIGEAKNCISAHTVPNSPVHLGPACAVSAALAKLTTSRGSTGMMIPNASMSSATVMKMKRTVARRAWGWLASGMELCG